MTYYKVLDGDGRSSVVGHPWPLPNGDAPGEWIRAEGELIACENGIHLCRESDLVRWLGARIFEAEPRGDELVESDTKVVVREARLVREFTTWNERTQRLFSCDCAERALQCITDDNARATCAESIAVARRYADGEATEYERNAASAAAWGAVNAAARGAARGAARDAARDAAWGAACGAVNAAAWGAVNAAARAWQIERLMEYLQGERS